MFVKGIRRLVTVLFLFGAADIMCPPPDEFDESYLPAVTIAALVRNKEFILPYFLTGIQNMDYPKYKITIWFYSDYNSDRSINILKTWKKNYRDQYDGVHIHGNESSPMFHVDEPNVTSWTPQRFKHVMKLRQKALNFAKYQLSDYIFMVDADVVFTEPGTLKFLIQRKELVISPMLLSDGLYSNFWHDMREDYTYQRTPLYVRILKRDSNLQGCHNVPIVHSAVLIDLRTEQGKKLTYDSEYLTHYNGPEEDTLIFCASAMNLDALLKVCNDRLYGFVTTPSADFSSSEKEFNKLLNMKVEALSRGIIMPVAPSLFQFLKFPLKSKLGMCKIFMINLDRRKDRRKLMIETFKELGMEVTVYEAVDGKKLSKKQLDDLGIKLMQGYEDPYHGRPMKAGEIGCFLSHYNLWKEVIRNKYKLTMIIEDDVHFTPYFREKLARLLDEVKMVHFDVLYVGRKILVEGEPKVTAHTVRPSYTYWTLGYIITLEGAQKLIDAEPLKNLLPVDEYLPIMFDAHPNVTWLEHFPVRNVKALSASPLLMNPTHYTGMEGYISDTEDSLVLVVNKIKHKPIHL